MCDTVFTLQSLLYTHFDQHVVSQKVSVFKCPDCSMHYSQKQLMMDHIKVSTEHIGFGHTMNCFNINSKTPTFV